MNGTHVANCLVRGQDAVRRWSGRIRGAGGSRTHSKPLCRRLPCRLAPAPRYPVSSPAVEPGTDAQRWSYDLRTVACKSGTLRGHSFQRPTEESNPVLQIRSLPCYPVHLQGKRLDQELNLDLDLRRVLCDPLHHRDVQCPDLESNQGQGLRRALCNPLHHRDGQTRADGWTCTSMMRFTEPPPRFSATSASLKHEREESNPVGRLWRPSALPGARSCIGPRPCDRGPLA
jgi:hypothetical protein